MVNVKMVKNVYKIYYSIVFFVLFSIIFIFSIIFYSDKSCIALVILIFSFVFAFILPCVLVISAIRNRITIDNIGLHLFKFRNEIQIIKWDYVVEIQIYRGKLSVIEIEYNLDGIKTKNIYVDYRKRIMNSLINNCPEKFKTLF